MPLLFISADIMAQQVEMEEAVRRLVGYSELETLESDQLETFYSLYLHPININNSSRSRLESTGLFTPYQLASLIDYRNRHGNIMSVSELSLVDGFTKEYVSAISSFVALNAPMFTKGHDTGFDGDIMIRSGYKENMSKNTRKTTYGLKARMEYADKFSVALAATEPYDSLKPYPTLYSASLMYQHRFGKIVIGDFNARFAQGLYVWNTADFSSLNSPSAFMKRPSGISSVNSFTGSSALTGIAADLSSGAWKLTAMFSVPGIRQVKGRSDKLQIAPAINLINYGRFGHIGVTHNMAFSSFTSMNYRIPRMTTSLDGSFCISGANLFGECGYDWVERKFSVLTGSEFGLGECVRMAALVRYQPTSNEHEAAAAIESSLGKHHFQTSADVLYHPKSKSKDGIRSYQIKGYINWMWDITTMWQTRIRIAERFRTWGSISKTELRSEIKMSVGNWRAGFRSDALWGRSFAGLAYVEAAYIYAKVSAYFRYGIFHVDNWDDRIYVYERDAPGNFNVPSFYGRGFWNSVYISYKPVRWCRLYLRGVYKKPGNAELKLYCSLEF